MLAFQHPAYLYLLLLLPVFAGLFLAYRHWRQKRLRQLGDQRLVLAQLQGAHPRGAVWRFALLALAFTGTVLGAANLRRPGEVARTNIKGVDVMIALDVSKSMLATDVPPSRLVRSRQFIERLLAQLHNDRAGLILFAGRAYQQVPLTTDFSALRMLLQHAGPQIVPAQGTVISDAISLAQEGFPKNEKKYRTLLLISDGEDHEAKAVTEAKKAYAAGLVIHTIGVGSPEGTTIPDPETGRVKLDANNQPVISKLNENMLRQIAGAAGGTYTLLQNPDAAASVLAEAISKMEQQEMGTVQYTNYTSYFQLFLLPALICLLLAGLTGREKPTRDVATGKQEGVPAVQEKNEVNNKEVVS